MVFLVIPDTERTYAELDVFFFAVYALRNHLNEQVHVIPPPIGNMFKSIWVLPEGPLIGNRPAGNRVWVEIVVEMDTINVIIPYDIGYNTCNILPNLWNAGVKEFFSAVDKKPIRFKSRNVIAGCICSYQVECCPIGVDPGVQFHTTFMSFVDCKFQWVVKRYGRLPWFTSQKTAPRFGTFGVKCVGRWSYLQENGINTSALVAIQMPDELQFLLGRTQVTRRRAVDIDHRRNPGSPELPLGERITSDS